MAAEEQDKTGTETSNKFMHFAMMACCILMLLPVAGVLLTGNGFSLGGLGMATVTPLLLCVGAHLVLHKMMGKSCHGKDHTAEKETRADGNQSTTSDVSQAGHG